VAQLTKSQAGRLTLEVSRPASTIEDHDRILLWHVRIGTDDRFYRVLLGQGLVGFERFCNRRSEGVVLRIDGPTFDTEWIAWH
jgi:hypothetical protein